MAGKDTNHKTMGLAAAFIRVVDANNVLENGYVAKLSAMAKRTGLEVVSHTVNTVKGAVDEFVLTTSYDPETRIQQLEAEFGKGLTFELMTNDDFVNYHQEIIRDHGFE